MDKIKEEIKSFQFLLIIFKNNYVCKLNVKFTFLDL